MNDSVADLAVATVSFEVSFQNGLTRGDVQTYQQISVSYITPVKFGMS